MPIYELGYRHWEGPLRGKMLRWWPITRTGIALGLRSKMLRRLCFAAWAPLLYFAPLFFAVGSITDPTAESSRIWSGIAREFFDGRAFIAFLSSQPEQARPIIWSLVFGFYLGGIQLFLSLIMTAIAAPPQISRDIRSKAFLVYFSKPITRAEYLIGKAGAVLAFLFWATLFPALLLYVLSAVFSPSLEVLDHTATIAPKIVAAALFTTVPMTAIGLTLSSFSKDERYAAFGWIGIWIIGEVAYNIVRETGGELADSAWIIVLSIRETFFVATQYIFGAYAQLEERAPELLHLDVPGMERVEGGPLALVWLAGITVVCTAVLWRRVSAPMRI